MSTSILTILPESAGPDGTADRSHLDKQRWLREWERWNYAGADENRYQSSGDTEQQRQVPVKSDGQPVSVIAAPAPRDDAISAGYEGQIALIQAGGGKSILNGDIDLQHPQQRISERAPTPPNPSPREYEAPARNDAGPMSKDSRHNDLLLAGRRNILRYLERNQFNSINLQVNTRHREVTLWLRDYRSGQHQRLNSILTDVKAMLHQCGYKLAKVWVNGRCLAEES